MTEVEVERRVLGVRWWRSLRMPIAAVLAMSVIAVALVYALVADRNTMSDGVSRLRIQAEEQLSAATVVYEFTGTVMGNASLIDTADPESGLPAGVLAAARGNNIATYFDGRRMWAVNAVSDTKVMMVETSAWSLLHERGDLHRSLLLVGLLTLAIAALGGWTAAGSLTGRLRRAARWVDVGATVDPASARLGRDGDEVGELVARIDRLSTTLRDRVRTERAFTADVAHELRTPLTALVSAVELLPDDHRATGLVRQQVRRLRQLVDELLELARADQDQRVVNLQSVDVVAMLAEIAVQLPDLAPDEVIVVNAAQVRAEPQRLERVLVNLLANARRHGAAPVHVRVTEDRVVIHDSGPGFPEELLASGPQRLRALGRSAGSGLGLAIVQTYSQQMNASVSLANADGAEVTLRLRTNDGSGAKDDGTGEATGGSADSVTSSGD